MLCEAHLDVLREADPLLPDPRAGRVHPEAALEGHVPPLVPPALLRLGKALLLPPACGRRGQVSAYNVLAAIKTTRSMGRLQPLQGG